MFAAATLLILIFGLIEGRPSPVLPDSVARAHVLAVARTWIGTPFHDHASKKGIGVDCAHLLREVAVEAGLIAPFTIEHYSPQFMLHRDTPLFETYVRRFAHEIDAATVKPADIVLYKVGRVFAHGGFVVDWPAAVIHAFKTFGHVAETPAFEADLSGREVKFFSFW